MDLLEEKRVDCPCCGETISMLIDTSGGDQSYVEDCQVCCRPLVVSINVSGAEAMIDVQPENA